MYKNLYFTNYRKGLLKTVANIRLGIHLNYKVKVEFRDATRNRKFCCLKCVVRDKAIGRGFIQLAMRWELCPLHVCKASKPLKL